MIKNYKKHILFIFIASILSLSIIVISLNIFYFKYKNKILPGVTVEGIDVSGFDEKNFQKTIPLYIEKRLQKRVTLNFQKNVWVYTFKELGVAPDLSSTFENAYKIGREEKLTLRLKSLWKNFFYKQNVKIIYTVENKRYEETIKNIKDFFYIPERDASFEITPDNEVKIKGHKNGRRVVEEKLKKLILENFKKNIFKITIPLEEVKPKITTKDLEAKNITGLLGEYTTYYNVHNENRTHNILLASRELDGTEIKPGEIFSFNDTVGPRTRERGYKEAEVIVDGEFQPGIGGGICQLSSTLYNAVLAANLEIVERKTHSLEIGYVPKGCDATVAYGLIDFKFKNNTNSYILLKSFCENGILSVRVFGNQEERM